MATGIYRMYNKHTGQSYIGASRNLEGRERSYRWTKSHKAHIAHQEMYRQGIHNFCFEVLEYLEDGAPRTLLSQRESYWIGVYKAYWLDGGLNLIWPGKPGYNSPQRLMKSWIYKLKQEKQRIDALPERERQKKENRKRGGQRGGQARRGKPRTDLRKLTPDQVREIRHLHGNGKSYSELGKKFGIPSNSVRQITQGITYRDVA